MSKRKMEKVYRARGRWSIGIAAASLLAVGLTGFLTLPNSGTTSAVHDEGHPAKGERARGQRTSGANAGLTYPLQWLRGIQYNYRFELASATTQPSGTALISAEVSGDLHVLALSPRVLRVTFDGELPAVGGAQAPSEGQARQLLADLKADWYVHFAEGGYLESVATQTEVSPFVQTLWEGVGASLQYVPRAVSNGAWSTLERDSAGAYHAQYRAENSQRIVRTKLKYEPQGKRLGAPTPKYAVEQSSALFQLGPERELLEFHLSERVRVDGVPAVGTLHTDSRISLSSISRIAYSGDLSQLLAEAKKLEGRQKSAKSEALDRARTQGMNWEQALLLVRAVKVQENPSEEERLAAGRALIALTAFLRLDPSYVTTAVQGVHEGGALARTFLNALRDADTPESRAALIGLSESTSLSKEMRIRSSTALSLTGTSSKTTIAALKSLRSVPELKSQATFGIGTALNRLPGDDKTSNETLNYMLRELQSSEAPHEIAAWLESLGNAGQADSLPLVDTYSRHRSERVRAAAAQAVRRIRTPAASMLINRLLTDESDSVRASALDTLSEMGVNPATAASLAGVISSDPRAGNRVRAIRVAADSADEYPQLRRAIALAARDDDTESVRQLASSKLKTLAMK